MLPWHSRKHLFRYCVFSHCQGNNVFTDLFPISGYCTAASLLNCCLAVCLHDSIKNVHRDTGYRGAGLTGTVEDPIRDLYEHGNQHYSCIRGKLSLLKTKLNSVV
jgi:hypothetical protein